MILTYILFVLIECLIPKTVLLIFGTLSNNLEIFAEENYNYCVRRGL
jgi:hypothetical protein